MSRTTLALVPSLLLVVLAGCKADRCRDAAPAFQLDVVLPAGVDGSQVSLLAVTVDAAGLHRAQDVPISGQLAGGRTTVAVDVGAKGQAGFSADIAVEARDATGRVLARGQRRFTGSGDACNVFTLVLAGGSDGFVADGPASDRRTSDGPVKPSLAWTKRFGAAGADEGHAVAVDGNGNVLVTGSFAGIVDFGGGFLPSGGESDVFVASYSSTGAFRWANRFGSTSADSGQGIAVDGQGNATVTGFFQGTVDFGGGPLTSAGGQDIFVASYSSTGTFRWARRLGDTGSDFGYGVAVDGSGNVTVTGTCMGTMDFGGGPLGGAGTTDIFVASYSSSGAYRWAKRFGETFWDYGQGVAVDGSGNVTITGSFMGAVDFGGGPLSASKPGATPLFVASYSSTGAFRWAKHFGPSSQNSGYGVAVDGKGNVTVTGKFSGTVDLGGGPLTAAVDGGFFVASYSSTGAFRWVKRLGATTPDDRGYGVAVDAGGNVTVTGALNGTVDFGGGPLATAGGCDIVIASYSSTGVFRWARRFGATGNDRGFGVAVAGSGHVAVTGSFQNAVDFGGGSVPSAGADDIFLLELVP